MKAKALTLLSDYGLLLVLLALVAVSAIMSPLFLTYRNLANLLTQVSYNGLLAVGMTFVILIGGIDLSIQAVASLSSVVVAMLVPRLGYAAFPAALGAGLLCGLFSGIAHVKLHVPSFIATLAASGVAGGIALLVSGARAVTIGEAGRAYLQWVAGSVLGIPAIILLGAMVLVAGMLVQRYTPFGRYGLAIGAGEAAALASGVRVDRHKMAALAVSGVLASLAGIFLAARMASGSPMLANQLMLPAVAAVLVGGTAITGGVGGVGRTLIGALIVSVVRIGMTFLGVNIFAQQILFGAVLIVAVALTIDRSKIPIVK